MSGTIESQLRYHAKHPDTPPPLRGLMLRAVEELRYRAMVIEQRNAEIKRGHDDFVQAITDPENQPSQWGTVTLAMYEKLELDTAAPAPQAQEPIAKLFGTLPVYDTPEPQAQDKSDNYLSGYCTGRTDLLKEQSAQPAQGVPEVGFGNMQSAQPVAQITDAAIREIADCIVSNLDSRKGVIDLDLDDDMVEEIMQEMCDTIAHGIREVK